MSSISLAIMGMILLSGLAAIIALLRFGVRTFWVSDTSPARLKFSEALPVTFLLLFCVILTLQAGPVFSYLERASADLHNPALYVTRVLSEPTVAGVQSGGR